MREAKTRICNQPIQDMSYLELFGPQQRVDQVGRQQHRKNCAHPIFELHGCLQVIAGLSVGPSHCKEGDSYRDENDVCHKTPMINRIIVVVPSPYSFTSSAAVSRFSFLTKSGEKPGTNEPGSP